jgi:hypothetical protein
MHKLAQVGPSGPNEWYILIAGEATRSFVPPSTRPCPTRCPISAGSVVSVNFQLNSPCRYAVSNSIPYGVVLRSLPPFFHDLAWNEVRTSKYLFVLGNSCRPRARNDSRTRPKDHSIRRRVSSLWGKTTGNRLIHLALASPFQERDPRTSPAHAALCDCPRIPPYSTPENTLQNPFTILGSLRVLHRYPTVLMTEPIF